MPAGPVKRLFRVRLGSVIGTLLLVHGSVVGLVDKRDSVLDAPCPSFAAAMLQSRCEGVSEWL